MWKSPFSQSHSKRGYPSGPRSGDCIMEPGIQAVSGRHSGCSNFPPPPAVRSWNGIPMNLVSLSQHGQCRSTVPIAAGCQRSFTDFIPRLCCWPPVVPASGPHSPMPWEESRARPCHSTVRTRDEWGYSWGIPNPRTVGTVAPSHEAPLPARRTHVSGRGSICVCRRLHLCTKARLECAHVSLFRVQSGLHLPRCPGACQIRGQLPSAFRICWCRAGAAGRRPPGVLPAPRVLAVPA